MRDGRKLRNLGVRRGSRKKLSVVGGEGRG